MNKFKFGVSDWKFKFPDQEVLIKCVIKETISYDCKGSVRIAIREATIADDVLNLFKKGNTVEKIIQNYMLKNGNGEEIEHDDWEYDNLEITSFSINSSEDKFATVDIKLKSK